MSAAHNIQMTLRFRLKGSIWDACPRDMRNEERCNHCLICTFFKDVELCQGCHGYIIYSSTGAERLCLKLWYNVGSGKRESGGGVAVLAVMYWQAFDLSLYANESGHMYAL